MQESIQLVIDSLPFLLKGAGYTLQLSIGGMFFGLLLGFILALMRLSPIWPVRWLARFYISIFRGTPLIAQLFMIYYGLPQFGIELDPIPSAMIGLSLNTAAYAAETLRADAVICAMGGEAGPQFGTDGFGTRFAAQCGGRVEPLYPCLTALQCAKPRKALAGIRAKAAASLLDGARVLACENGEVQFTDYGLSGICIMQLSGLLAPGRGPKAPAVELDLFPAVDETALASLFAAHAAQTAGGSAADFWLGLLNQKLGRIVWSAAGLQDSDAPAVLTAAQWQKLAHTAKHWRFEGLTPCSWKQAQTTGGGLALREVDQHFQFKGCPGLYFVGETLDCAGSCGGFNLHWAFGSGLVAGRSAAGHAAAGRALPKASAPAKSRKKLR